VTSALACDLGRAGNGQGRRLWRDVCGNWRRGSCSWYADLCGNRAQHFATITEDDAKLFQVLIGQVAKDREINPVFSKTLGVFGHAEFFEPVRNLLHRGPLRVSTLSALDRLDNHARRPIAVPAVGLHARSGLDSEIRTAAS